jgi:hypothetical protein
MTEAVNQTECHPWKESAQIKAEGISQAEFHLWKVGNKSKLID